MRIGIIGLGSIGKRHANCLKDEGITEIIALRSKKGYTQTLDESLSFIDEVFDLESFLGKRLDGVIISNPTSLHASSSLPILKAGVPVLIEKPITGTLSEVETILEFGHKIRVAYCMRFHSLVQKVKTIIKEETYGKVFKVGFNRSFYLPFWHPYADYRLEYTAKKALGGGVVRTLSHEIDLMLHLFGECEAIKGMVGKVSKLEIDTDDFAYFTCKSKSGVITTFQLDFFNPINVATADFITEKGRLEYDLVKGRLAFYAYENPEAKIISSYDLQDFESMYSNQTKDFLKWIDGGNSINATMNESLQVLKLIEELESEGNINGK